MKQYITRILVIFTFVVFTIIVNKQDSCLCDTSKEKISTFGKQIIGGKNNRKTKKTNNLAIFNSTYTKNLPNNPEIIENFYVQNRTLTKKTKKCGK